MNFPTWVTEPDLASKRLRYMINRAAVERVVGCSIAEFADYCGVDVSTMHNAISAGAFSPRSAMKIERAVNDQSLITAASLCYPLDIE